MAPHAVPEPAEDHRREHQQQDLEAQLVVDLLGQPEQHAGQPGQRRTDDPDERMTRSTSMPEAEASAGLSDTARVALPMRVLQQGRGDQRQRGQRDSHDPQVAWGVTEGPEVDRTLDDELVVGAPLAREEVQVEISQEQSHADRDDHHGDQAASASAQRPPEPDVLGPAEPPADRDRQGASSDDG